MQKVVASLSEALGQVLEFTTEIDNRRSGVLGSYGFFVELASDAGPSLVLSEESSFDLFTQARVLTRL